MKGNRVVYIDSFDKKMAKIEELGMVRYKGYDLLEKTKMLSQITDDWLTYLVVSYSQQDQTQHIELVVIPDDDFEDSVAFQIDWDLDALKSFLEFYYCNKYWRPVEGKSMEEAICDLIGRTV